MRISRATAIGLMIAAVLAPSLATRPASAAAPLGGATPADLTLGGTVILRLRADAAGLSPVERVAAITDRLTDILAVPRLKPADVVVYVPPTRGGAPVIYVLGRRLITVDAATARAAGGGAPLTLATTWAKRLQQVLPLVDIRLPSDPEPKVPPHPPLTITHRLSDVGGNVGEVKLRDHVVMILHGIQPGGETAAERADALSHRLALMVNQAVPLTAGTVQSAATSTSAASPAQILVGRQVFFTVDASQAKASGQPSPTALAKAWVKNIDNTLGLGTTPPAAAATPPAPPASASTATPPAPPSPTTPAPTTPSPTTPAPATPAPTTENPPGSPAAPPAPTAPVTPTAPPSSSPSTSAPSPPAAGTTTPAPSTPPTPPRTPAPGGP